MLGVNEPNCLLSGPHGLIEFAQVRNIISNDEIHGFFEKSVIFEAKLCISPLGMLHPGSQLEFAGLNNDFRIYARLR